LVGETRLVILPRLDQPRCSKRRDFFCILPDKSAARSAPEAIQPNSGGLKMQTVLFNVKHFLQFALCGPHLHFIPKFIDSKSALVCISEFGGPSRPPALIMK